MVRIMRLGRRSAANVRSSCNGSSHVCATSLDLAAAPREGGCGGNALLKLAGTKSERLDLVYAREPLMHLRGDTFPTDRALPPHSLQRLGQRLAAEALRLLLRKLANGEVRLLLAGTRFTEGYTPDLHLRAMGARALRVASHLARSRRPRRLAQENFPPTGTGPPASHTHATGQCSSDLPRAHPAEGHLQPGNRHSGRSASVRWQACTLSPPPSWLLPRSCRSEFAFSFLPSALAVSPMPD